MNFIMCIIKLLSKSKTREEANLVIKALIIFEQPENPAELDEFIQNVYIPSAVQFPGIERIELTHHSLSLSAVLHGKEDETSPIYAELELYFQDMQAFQRALQSEVFQQTIMKATLVTHDITTITVGRVKTYYKSDIVDMLNRIRLKQL